MAVPAARPFLAHPANQEHLAVSARAAALTAAFRLQVAQRQERQGRLAEAWQETTQIVADAATELNDLLKFYVHSQDSGYRAAELLGNPPFTPYDAQSAGWLLLPAGQERPDVTVIVAAAYRVLREGEPAAITAIVRVDRILDHGNIHEPHVIWTQTYPGIPVASAQQANVFAGIRARFRGSFAGTLRQVIEILSSFGSPQ